MYISRYLLIAVLVAFAYSKSMNIPMKHTDASQNFIKCICGDGSEGTPFQTECNPPSSVCGRYSWGPCCRINPRT